MATANDHSGERIAAPPEFFIHMYVGRAEAEGNSLYRCMKCPTGRQGKRQFRVMIDRVLVTMMLRKKLSISGLHTGNVHVTISI